MTEKCPHCGSEFANTKALGSHVHYMHTGTYADKGRSQVDEKRFRLLLNGCLSERGMPRPRHLDKVEKAITEIPQGVSPSLDQYRDAFKCAQGKEKLLGEVEEMLRESNAEKGE